MVRLGKDNPFYKGGRTKRISAYVNPDVKKRLAEVAKVRNETMADTLEYLILSEHRMIANGGYKPLPTPTMAPLVLED